LIINQHRPVSIYERPFDFYNKDVGLVFIQKVPDKLTEAVQGGWVAAFLSKRVGFLKILEL